MNITPLDIKQKQFKLKFRGFDIQEVDGFLEEVTAEMESMLKENEFLKDQNATMEAQLAEFKLTEQSLRNTLISAQKMAEEMKTSSLRDANLKVKEAELEAERILRDARLALAKATEEINELKRIRERFSIKIRGVIEDHLKMLSYDERQGTEKA